ncbi:hypothetical protein AAVH_37327, partial [Aphelenchoides avenae]
IISVADSPDTIYVDLEIFDVEFGLTFADVRHSTEWLAGVNATRKWIDGELHFAPGCLIIKGYWRDVPLPACNAWYLLLIGELRLRESPKFTVRTLELCLFALSGSVFLLII